MSSSAPLAAPRSGYRAKLSGRSAMLLALAAMLGAFQLCGAGSTAARAQAGISGTTTPPGATTYSTTRRIFNVGILLIDSTTATAASGSPASEIAKGPENPDPYVFYVAEQRLDLKPQNWELANPLAPATVTDQIKTRWDARAGGVSGYQIGQKVTKDMAAYWEVSLTSTTLPDLLKYDLLFVTNHRSTNFLPADREKLRKLVDAGGVFWMEDCGNMRIGGGSVGASGSFFLSNIQFQGNAFGNFTTSGPVVNVPNHPLLTAPYQLSLQEIANLGDKNYGNFAMGSYVNATTAGATQPDPEVLVNVVGNSAVLDSGGKALPYIAAGYYGSGSILLTSGDSGCDINDYCGGMATSSGGNSGPFAGTNIQAAHTEDLKFLYNIVDWGSANTAYRRNDRRSATSYETLSAPLLPSFNFAGLSRAGDQVSSITSPLIVNGLMYISGIDATNGKNTIRCYDTQPFRDYDGDGNYDDGLPDVALGLPYDEIWRYEGTSSSTEQPSPPIFSSVNIPQGNNVYLHRDLLFMTEPNGQLDILQATPTNANTGQLLSAQPAIITVPPDGLSKNNYDVGATHGVSPAPVVYGDLVFQVEPDGLVRCINAGTGNIEWNSFDTSAGPSETILPTGTPTLGFSQLNSNTAISTNSDLTTNDLMLYVPTVITPQSQTGSSTSYGQMLAYWVGTRNEVQRQFSPAGTVGSGGGADGFMPVRVGGGQGAPTLVSTTSPAVLLVANGPDTFQNSPFATPIIRGVYSPTYNYSVTPPEITASAQDNYTAGNASTDYYAIWEPGANNQYTGRVQIKKLATANANALQPGNGTNEQNGIIVAVDYDVSYLVPPTADIAPSTMAQTTAYDNNAALQKIGQIQNSNLTVTNYSAKQGSSTSYTAAGLPGGGLDTATFSPDDMLLFTADQMMPTTGTGNGNGTTPIINITSVFSVHPQADQSSTMLKWRFGLHKSGDADGTVNGQIIVDNAPIFNYTLFNTPAPGSLPTAGTLQTLPEYISRLEAIGPPITTPNGITYVLASGYSSAATTAAAGSQQDGINPNGLKQGVMTILMAYTTSPSITLTLPIPFDPTAGATVSQVNALDPGTTISASGTTTSVPILLDGPRGRVTIQNFNAGGGQFSASQSFVVTVTPVNQTSQVSYVIRPTPTNASTTYGSISPDSGSYTPLQWYYVLKGVPMSPPTMIGDYLFFTMGTGSPATLRNGGPTFQNPGNTVLVAVDANPQANDPSIRAGFGEPLENVVSTLTDTNNKTTTPAVNHVHWVQSLNNDTTTLSYAPPVGSQGTMAINSTLGTFAYQDEPTLIADAKRLVEVAPGSDATWALNASSMNLVVGGDLPIFGDGGTTGAVTITNGAPSGATLLVNKALSHPSTARKIGSSDYLIADTGNNRVIRVDRSGKIIWKLDQLSNDYNILGGGDPVTLSGPTDVQYYIAPTLTGGTVNAQNGQYSGGTISGYEVHYLIADPGNYRIVEVADYFDTKGNALATLPNMASGSPAVSSAGKHEVVWTTRTQSQQSRSLRYTSIQRYLGIDPQNQYSGYPYIIATVSNSSVGGIVGNGNGNGAGTDNTGSSLVSVHYAPYDTVLPANLLSNGAQIGLELWVPPIVGQGIITSDPVADGTVIAAADDLRETINSNTSSSFGMSGQSTPTLGNESEFLIRRLQRATSFSQINLPNLTANPPTVRTIYLICDVGAVYAVEATTDTTTAANNGPLPVRNILWKFTQADYDVMNYQRLLNSTPATDTTGRILQPVIFGNNQLTPNMLPRFAPSSIQLLPNGDFLIANAYQGPNGLFQSGEFNGEVFQVTPKTIPGSFGANGYQAVSAANNFSLYTAASAFNTAEGGIFDSFSSPLLQFNTPLENQVTNAQGSFLQIMGAGGNTNLLEQPLFAIRP